MGFPSGGAGLFYYPPPTAQCEIFAANLFAGGNYPGGSFESDVYAVFRSRWGQFFDVWPAMKAAALDSAEASRYEWIFTSESE